jgi:DNA-binding MarR family transcriptional regulator
LKSFPLKHHPPRSLAVSKDGIRTSAVIAGNEELITAALDGDVMELIELFFFAYRDFVGDADRLLDNYGFGRAHHRVLHFVQRRPGLTIAALLDILKITKQSLNRVLKQLLDEKLVESRAGPSDRRQRLLFLTTTGSELARELAYLQAARFKRVLDNISWKEKEIAIEFLYAMIDEDQRPQVKQHLRHAKVSLIPNDET